MSSASPTFSSATQIPLYSLTVKTINAMSKEINNDNAAKTGTMHCPL